MKKIYFSIGLFLATINPILSQKNKLEFGIKAALNYSSFTNDKDEGFPINYQGKIGVQIGGLMNLNLTEKIAIQPEVLFSVQNSDFLIDFSVDPDRPPGIPAGIDGDIKEFMILVPITLKYSFNEKINFNIGPQLGYNLNRTIEYNDSNVIGEFLKLTSNSNIEFGVIVDLGYNLGKKIRTGIRYSYGITKRIEANSSVFSIGIDYRI
ncbi:porin family protein [uncultured Aquimarina sp.]|uniref:porin family protein n=1 Tax=uncultured Aquimarina sp. TaxID=575652 RepID=UPI00263A2DC7|nr:porin family protein [uncultured Aquimarina sp.]